MVVYRFQFLISMIWSANLADMLAMQSYERWFRFVYGIYGHSRYRCVEGFFSPDSTMGFRARICGIGRILSATNLSRPSTRLESGHLQGPDRLRAENNSYKRISLLRPEHRGKIADCNWFLTFLCTKKWFPFENETSHQKENHVGIEEVPWVPRKWKRQPCGRCMAGVSAERAFRPIPWPVYSVMVWKPHDESSLQCWQVLRCTGARNCSRAWPYLLPVVPEQSIWSDPKQRFSVESQAEDALIGAHLRMSQWVFER